MGLLRRLFKGAADSKDREISSYNSDISTCARRTACVLALDISGSMKDNDNIGRLNIGLREFKAQVAASDVREQLDVAVIAYPN